MPTTTAKLRAFHGVDSIKEKYLNRVSKHREADQLLQNYGYWADGKGCAVGCTLHSENHLDYETELGIPVALAYLEDRLFERLPVAQARLWPERFLTAPKVGADLTLVPHQFAIWLLTDPQAIIPQVVKDKEALEIINAVADLYRRFIAGDKPSVAEWEAVSSRASEASARAWKAYDDALALALLFLLVEPSHDLLLDVLQLLIHRRARTNVPPDR